MIPGTTGEQLTPTRKSGLGERAHGVEAQIRTRSAGLEDSRQLHVESGDRDVDGKAIRLRDFFQQVEVANNEIRLGHDAELEATMMRELFQNSAGDFVAALGRLVGIGGGAERDRFIGLNAAQFVAEQAGSVLLDVDLLLELHAIAHFHKLVGVAGVAVAASEFATAVRIDGPGEGHLTVADAAVQQRFVRESEVLDVVPFAEGFAFGGQPGDADQSGLSGRGSKGREDM